MLMKIVLGKAFTLSKHALVQFLLARIRCWNITIVIAINSQGTELLP